MDRHSTARGPAAALAITLLALSGVARAQPLLTTEVTAPASVDAGNSLNYALTYTVTGGDLENLVIVADLPAGADLVATSQPPGATADCVEEAPKDWRCTFTLAFAPGGFSGDFLIKTQTTAFEIPDSTILEALVTFDADHDEDGDGQLEPLPVVSDSASTTVHATPAPRVVDGANEQDWGANPNTGEHGLVFEYYTTVDHEDYGNAPLEAGWTLSVSLPPEMLYLGWNEAYLPGTFSELSAPPAWSTGDLTLQSGDPLIKLTDIGLRVWIACSDLPITAPYPVHAWAVDGTEVKADGPEAWHVVTSSNDVAELALFECVPEGGEGVGPEGPDGRADKLARPSDNVGVGSDLLYVVNVWPAHGVFPMGETVAVDRIPPELEFVAIESGPTPPDFGTFYCVAPGVDGQTMLDGFLATYLGAECGAALPADPATVTHLVFHAPTWGSEANIGHLAAEVLTRPRLGLSSGTVATNEILLASDTYGYNISASVSTNIHVEGLGFVENLPPGGGGDPLVPGEGFTFTLSAASEPTVAQVLNPVVEYTLPAGVLYKGATILPFDDFDAGCWWEPAPEVYDAEPQVLAGPDGTTILRWEFGDADHPTWLPLECPKGDPRQYPLTIELNVQLDPEIDWIDGDSVTTVASLTGANMPDPATSETTVVVDSPGEMWTKVGPACDELDVVLLRVYYANTGGSPLSAVTITVEIPKSGGDSGSETDAFLQSVDAPAGTTLRYRVSGIWQDTLPADPATVEAVQLQIAMLLPASGLAHFDLHLSFPPGTPPGTRVYGRSTMDSAELIAVRSPLSAALTTEICPGSVKVSVFYDADEDGEWDPDEEALGGWVVTATNQETGETVSWTVGEDGSGSQSLPEGDWTITAEAPPGSDPDGNLEGGGVTTTVESGGTSELVFAISCGCDDLDLCTIDTCNAQDGACVFTPTTNPGVEDVCNDLDDDCNGLVDDKPGFPAGSACGPSGTTITRAPPISTEETTATFDYSYEEGAPGTGYECSIDGGAWFDCDGGTYTESELSEGEHTFMVRAVDPYGNVDPEPASYTWTVEPASPCPDDTAGPELVCGPAIVFECEGGVVEVDLSTIAPVPVDECTPITLEPTGARTLALGVHTITFTATDFVGNDTSCYREVRVADSQPPTIACAPQVALVADAQLCDGVAAQLDSGSVDDACEGSGLTAASDAPATFPLGETTVTWHATDASGNEGSCTTIVVVAENTASPACDPEPDVVEPGPEPEPDTGGSEGAAESVVPEEVPDPGGSEGMAEAIVEEPEPEPEPRPDIVEPRPEPEPDIVEAGPEPDAEPDATEPPPEVSAADQEPGADAGSSAPDRVEADPAFDAGVPATAFDGYVDSGCSCESSPGRPRDLSLLWVLACALVALVLVRRPRS